MNLFEALQDSNIQYAFIVGILVALCAALIGVPLVLKRYSMIGFGLSNVAFAGAALGAVMGLTNNLFLILPCTIIVAIFLLTSGKNAKVKGDAAIAMISVGTLALGYFLLNTFPVSANTSGDVCNSLFGGATILTLSTLDIWLCISMAMLVIIVYAIFYNKIFAITFDPDFVKATGMRAKSYEIFIATVIAIVVALSMRLVGSLLTAALIIFPALSAMRVFKNFKMVVICSAIIAVSCALLGLIIAITNDILVGPTIVFANIAVFAVCYITGLVVKRRFA